MNTKLPLDALISKLRLIEDLWDQLIYIKWSREIFLSLAQAVEQTLQILKDQDGYENIAKPISQLKRQITDILADEQLSHGVKREQLQVLLDSLRQALPPTEDRALEPGARSDDQPIPAREILLLAAEYASELIPELENAGYRVTHLSTLTELRTTLAETTPVVTLVDMDCSEGAMLLGINMISEGRYRIDLTAPIFFISERSDLAARLEAVSAGGAGYFTKPVDVPILLETLDDHLAYQATYNGRVLLINDNPKEIQKITLALEDKGVIVNTLKQPMKVLQVVHHFQPDLLLLDLDLREVNGIELAKAISQYKVFDNLPLILLSSQSHLNQQRLFTAGAYGDHILYKPLNSDHLMAVVTHHLRQTRIFQHKLNHLSRKDPVSGLYNRRHFLHQLQRALLETSKHPVAVMLINMDNLRAVEASDLTAIDDIVEQAARRLQKLLPAHQQAARLGDAIFAVLVLNADRETVVGFARHLHNALENDAYTTGGDFVQLRTSIGISITADGKQPYASLIQQADLACNSAWMAGGDRIHIYDFQADQMRETSPRERLLEKIHEAVQQETMSLVFQPIVNLRGDPGERYEVLLRIRNPSGQALLSRTVFGTTQQHRLGVILDRWVIAHSIHLLRERQTLNRPTVLFINISPAILQDESFITWLTGALRKTAILSKNLVFEMAETMAKQHLQKLRALAEKIKMLGCGFSLDHFGNQEYSLDLLNHLPVDYVKLDAYFTRDLAKTAEKQRQLKALTERLNELQITIVAGNVEDFPTLCTVSSCGINHAQGFLLQRPQEEMNYNFSDKNILGL